MCKTQHNVADLKEVFAIAQRISGNLQVLNNASEIDMCNAVFEETSNKWHMILNLVGKSSPNVGNDCRMSVRIIVNLFISIFCI